MNTTAFNNQHTESTAQLRAYAEARVATCDIYLNSRALVGQNTVVVSSLTNGRGAQLGTPNADGGQLVTIQMFDGGMPTCFAPKAAADLVYELNQHLEATGAAERVSAINHIEWWANEKAAAQQTLAFLDNIEA